MDRRMTDRERLERMTHVPVIESCPDVCELAVWHDDPVFGWGQHNCPHHYGVTYAAAIVDGQPTCKYLKRKEAAGDNGR